VEKLSSGAKRKIADDTKTGSSSVSLSQDSTAKVTYLLDSQVSVLVAGNDLSVTELLLLIVWNQAN